LRSIKVLHLEPTDVCQAACPLCARELDTNFDKNQKHHLRIDQIQQHLDPAAIANLDKMFMCGNYGDPAAGQYTIEIYKHFRKLNPNIVLGMNSNGAIQSEQWWTTLGQVFNQSRDYCVFSIDGLADTNHVYRRNVNWEKLMSNASAFIAAGGSAHWDMLVYKHNQHQVDACEELAQDLGFTWFRAKVSKRGFTDKLEAPIDWQLPLSTVGKINCRALEEQSLYIDAQGRASPCCWQGERQHDFVKDDLATVQLSWNTNTPDPVCISACATHNNQTLFQEQWRKEIKFPV